MPEAASPDDKILAALIRSAREGPLPLQGTGSTGLFPNGVRGNPLAEAALQSGLFSIEEREVRSGRRSSTVKYASPSPKGLEHLAALESPKVALEALLPAIERLGVRRPEQSSGTHEEVRRVMNEAKAGYLEAVEKAVHDAAATVAKAVAEFQKALQTASQKVETAIAKVSPTELPKKVQESLDKIGEAVQKTVSPTPDAPKDVDPGAVLHAVRAAAERVKSPASVVSPQPVAPPIPRPLPASTPPPPPPASGNEKFGQEILQFVASHAAETTVGAPFDKIFEHLRKLHPGISTGQFHDTLRTLYDARRIRLGGWPKMLDDMPDPELALFVSSKVMYYVKPE